MKREEKRPKRLLKKCNDFCRLLFAAALLPTAILVDKHTHKLDICQYENGAYKIVKSFHVTLGRVKGDKEDEGDLKTPEGIYTFKSLLKPPTLKHKFGKMAFYIAFPNDYDRMAGHTGSNSMLHATDEPERLNKNYDSLGCIVVKNEEIEAIRPYVRLGLTPILIFSDLTPDYLTPGQGPEGQKLKAFFDSWLQDWQNKDIEGYMAHYHSQFSSSGKDKSQWKAYKESLSKRYTSIEIEANDVLIYRHPKYAVITFTQDYRSKLKGGGWGHRSHGTKLLYVAEEAGQPKIIAESFTTLRW